MSKQNISDTEHQLRYAEEIREARLAGMNLFQSWFNKSKDINQSIVRGYWDFTFNILTLKVCEYIENPEEKIALEIGYGGGRILNAACSYFKEVIGIDIHDEQQTVEAFLKSQGKNNFRLIKTSGRTIDVDSESIDFIYSFIVLQHLPSFDVFVSYLKESYRCLKLGGVAQLYFGKWSKLNKVNQLRYVIQGYKEIPEAPVNYTSLVVHVSKMKKLCRDIGFKVLEIGTSYKRVPDGYPKKIGGQNYVALLKKREVYPLSNSY
jgi:ubiquinone/menaquinone biosynthesis C-methylase UbiE